MGDASEALRWCIRQVKLLMRDLRSYVLGSCDEVVISVRLR